MTTNLGTRWILDTDHVSLFLSGNLAVIQRMSQHLTEIATTVVTVQELFNGWVGRLNDPTQVDNLVILYTKLWRTTEFLKTIPLLNFDESAQTCYQQLLRQQKELNKKRLQKDLRIASIALATSSIMVTRNYQDFSKVPNLMLEDWTV